MTRTLVHFEIPANDPDKLTKFYTDLFGWKSQTIPELGYWMIETKSQEGEVAVTGGVMKKIDENQRPTNYISVESVDEYSRKISQLGGKIIMPKTEVPGRGFLAVALDPEGNPFGIWESTQK